MIASSSSHGPSIASPPSAIVGAIDAVAERCRGRPNTLISASAGVTLTAANGINDRGQIVGTGRLTSSNTQVAFVLTPAVAGAAARVGRELSACDSF